MTARILAAVCQRRGEHLRFVAQLLDGEPMTKEPPASPPAIIRK